MALDVSGLYEDDPAPVQPASGRPLLLKVADIDEDPDQPRTEFDLTEMRASIRARVAAGKPPIKQPISVKPNPEKPGRWLLNDGARRFRSCVEESVEEILGWVDDDHDDYDQVLVNNQHEKLRPMELALFIKKKLAKGDSKKVIAERLGYDNSVITHHQALIDAPDCVVNAYRSGKTKSPRTLYELRAAYERWPNQVDAWVESVDEVTRPQIAALIARLDAPLSGGDDAQDGASGVLDGGVAGQESYSAGQGGGAAADLAGADTGGQSGAGFGHDQISASSHEGDLASGQHEGADLGAAGGKDGFGHDQIVRTSGNGQIAPSGQDSGALGAAKGAGAPAGNGGVPASANGESDSAAAAGVDLTSWPKGHAVSDPDRMSKPLLLVEYEGRAAAVLLNRRPTTPGLLHIRFDDGGGDLEVAAALCKINLLTEGDK